MRLLPLMATAWVAGVLGDAVGFLVGRRLAAASVTGAGVWSATLTLGGYGFAHSFESHLQAAGNIALGLTAALTLAWVLWRRRKPRPSVASP